MFGLTPFNRNVVQKTNNEFVDFYNIIDDFFNDSFLPMRSLRNDTFKMDVKENEKEFLIEAEMPGVKKEEIKLDYNDGRLVISVQKDEQINEEKNNYIHRERRVSSMQRGVYLKNIKIDGIDAKLENGILKIVAPKLEIAENKCQIEIK
ncbi:MAG: Hsp20/alpha crystallin family protein [Clostridia bacterium]|jgi:HSP20 family protein|nr:Hsp20/alpha crystallin family protein [Clostridia bacterium]